MLRHHAERVHLLPAQHSVFSQAMVIDALKILGDSFPARTNASHGTWRDKPRHDLLATSVHLSWPYSIGLGLTSNEAV